MPGRKGKERRNDGPETLTCTRSPLLQDQGIPRTTDPSFQSVVCLPMPYYTIPYHAMPCRRWRGVAIHTSVNWNERAAWHTYKCKRDHRSFVRIIIRRCGARWTRFHNIFINFCQSLRGTSPWYRCADVVAGATWTNGEPGGFRLLAVVSQM